jgi:hypothetical protein
MLFYALIKTLGGNTLCLKPGLRRSFKLHPNYDLTHVNSKQKVWMKKSQTTLFVTVHQKKNEKRSI